MTLTVQTEVQQTMTHRRFSLYCWPSHITFPNAVHTWKLSGSKSRHIGLFMHRIRYTQSLAFENIILTRIQAKLSLG